MSGNEVLRLYRDKEASNFDVNFETLIRVELPIDDFYTDAYVMDGMVAVRVNDAGFEFFVMPLVENQSVEPVKKAARTTSIFDPKYTPPFDYTRLL